MPLTESFNMILCHDLLLGQMASSTGLTMYQKLSSFNNNNNNNNDRLTAFDPGQPG